MVALKYLINFWRTLERPLIDSEIDLDLNYSEKCIVVAGNAASIPNNWMKFLCSSCNFINSR